MSQVKRRKEEVIELEEREGAGLTLSWALPEPRELAKEKGDKGSDHRGRWGDEKTGPTALKPGIGVLTKGRVLPVHPVGWGWVTAIDCYSPGRSGPSPSPSPIRQLPLPAVYLLRKSKLFSPARGLAPTAWEKWCAALSWTLYFISANKTHFILYLGKAGWQNNQKMCFKRKVPGPQNLFIFLTYSKRVIRLLYFVDFLNKVKFSFSTV